MTSRHGDNTPGNEDESARRAEVLRLNPQRPQDFAALVVALGDASWRIRRVAIGVAIDTFPPSAELVHALVLGMASPDNAGLRNACSEVLVAKGSSSVDELASALSSYDDDLRKFAVEALGAIGTTAARDHLLQMLDAGDSNVRSAVVDALGCIGGPKVVDALKGSLEKAGDDLQFVVYLLDALARCGAVLSLHELKSWLSNRSLSRFVYPLLGLSQDALAVAPLMAGIASSSMGAREAAMVALVRLLRSSPDARIAAAIRNAFAADPNVVGKVIGALDSEKDAVAEAATVLVGLEGDASRAPALLRACAGRPFVRTAVEAVSAWGGRAVPALLQAIDAVDPDSRLLFLEVIEALGDEAATQKLLDLAESIDFGTAESAIRALGRVGGQGAIEPLVRFVDSEEEGISREAAFALCNLAVRHPDAVADRARRAIEDGDVRPAWLQILGAVGREQDLELLLAAARHAEPEIRRGAVAALSTFGRRVPLEVALRAAADDDPRVRSAAASVLAVVRRDEAAAALLLGLNDTDATVAAAMARALGSVNHPDATAALSTAAMSHNGALAIAALQGLFRRNPPHLAKSIEQALHHPDTEVVREAISASVRLPADKTAQLLGSLLSHTAWEIRYAAATSLLGRGLSVNQSVLQAALRGESEKIVFDVLEQLKKGSSTP